LKENVQPAMSLEEVPDHSLRLLIIDSAESGYVVSPEMMRRKMRPNDGQIVALASTLTPLAAAADFIVPVAAPFEKLDETPHPPSAGRETFSLALPLHPERPGAGDPLSFLVRLAAVADRPLPSATTMESLLRRRTDAIHASGRGTVYLPSNRSTVAVSDLGSADMLWGHLQAGGCWMDDPQKPHPRVTFRFPVPQTEQTRQAATDREIVLMPFGWKAATASAHVSPIMSKLFQESALRELDGIAVIAPATAAKHGLEDGKPARIATARGTKDVRVRCDAAARDGVVHVCVGPRPNGQDSPSSPAADELLSLCEIANDGTWRITMATIDKG
jgi:hypothetical protein